MKTRLAEVHAETIAKPFARAEAVTHQHKSAPAVTLKQAETFWQAAGTHALYLAGGVFLLIVGSGFTIVADTENDFSMMAFFIPALLGIAALVTGSKAFKAVRRPLRHLPVTAAVNEQASARRAAYHRRYVIGQWVGIVSLVAAFFIVSINDSDNESTFLMATLIGLGVFCLVYVHSIDHQYRRLAKRRVVD